MGISNKNIIQQCFASLANFFNQLDAPIKAVVILEAVCVIVKIFIKLCKGYLNVNVCGHVCGPCANYI